MSTSSIPRQGPMFSPAHPGAVIKDAYIETAGLTITAVADALGLAKATVSRVLSGRSQITADVALRMEKALGISAVLLLRMQDNYDLWHARQALDLSRVRQITLPTAS